MELSRPETSVDEISLDVFSSFEAARADWEVLFANAPASAYQSFGFALDWFETFGRTRGLTPMIVVARHSEGVRHGEGARPLALLALATSRLGPLRIAQFLGGKESNFNLGLFAADARLDAAALRTLLRRAARAGGVDLYRLGNQPQAFEGVANPLALPGSSASPSFAYGTSLPATASELDARFSADARKKLRKKQARLEKMGALVFEHCATGARAREILEALLAQKAERLQDPSFASGAMRDFVLGLCGGALDVHALTLDGRIIATYAGFIHRGRFSAMLNSFVAEEEIARSSPGDLLLHSLLRDLLARGVARFDLGVGEARYKNAVCDETIALVDTLVPATPLGALAAPVLSALTRAKRAVKQNPRLLATLTELRRLAR
ncbi:CelD/BcsL family acetyltransferase involved in cellulose biosynthesis [Methylosinus sp. sav-2]|uniref:GNAT family N-acetyltransferase n=1 Tax=Methylosinus sp. sav-2 TaxID=2485168 RepID=UPI00047D977B|nr:GNAT family N-acetyltransferase [Methylosinus sp. sav-2]TDX65063.1 CelD/BcsL family acetyltransferase involved in cellulose biosynthesis [Methylosinus sp. sav-2]